MDIVLFPDPRLRAKNAPVEVFDQELADLSRAMFEVMYRTSGVGLAAPQVGVNRRLLVYNPEGEPTQPEGEAVLCNPKILWKAKEQESEEEGCLSFPEVNAKVLRPLAVSIEAQDLGGKTFTLNLDGWESRIFLHEFDHLDGILFIDRFSPSDKSRVRPILRDLEADFKQTLADS